jgi:hypothetical protein
MPLNRAAAKEIAFDKRQVETGLAPSPLVTGRETRQAASLQEDPVPAQAVVEVLKSSLSRMPIATSRIS